MADEPKRKAPWEMTDDDVEDMILGSIDKGMHALDGEPARFKKGEGIEEVADDKALEGLTEDDEPT